MFFAFLDWDDTLAHTQKYFNQAIEQNVAQIVEHTNASPKEVRQRGIQLDVQTTDGYGLRKEWFPAAWVRCYRQFCQEQDIAPSKETAQEIYTRSAAVYQKKQALLDGAHELLQALKASGCEVNLWTSGEEDIQLTRVAKTGLLWSFDNHYVVLEKTGQTLSEALSDRPRERCFLVGNSLKSDIKPALELGIKAYHIPADTWAHDECNVDLQNPLYQKADDLFQVLELIKQAFEL